MSFDLLARHYSWMEWILAGRKLQRCRVAHLEAIKPCRGILLVGEGHGRFLEALLQACPEAMVTCVDASQEMLRVAEERLRCAKISAERVSFLRADLLDWSPPKERFDAVVTNFFLDCFTPEQLAVVAAKLGEAAAPQSVWLVSDFRQAGSGWAGLRTRWILWLMYRFFVVVTRLPARKLTPPDPYISAAGFRLVKMEIFDWGLLHADLWVRT